MSESAYSRSPRLLDINGVIELLARAQNEIKGFESFESGNLVMVELHPKSLTSMAEFEGLRVQSLRVEGALPLDEDPYPVFKQVLEAGREIGRKGQVCVTVGFEEVGCKQNKKSYDLSNIRIVKDVLKFTFSSTAKTPAHGRELMYKVASSAGLPLQFVDEGEGGYRLRHSQGGEIFIQMSLLPLELDPVSFTCSLPGLTVGDSVDLLKRFIRDFGTSKRFDYSWEAFPMPGDGVGEVSKEIYRTISVAPDTFRAHRYLLDADIHLDELADLEAIKSLCGEEDWILTSLGYYRPSDVNWVNLEIVTRADGHRLNVESRLGIDEDELGETLGLKLEKGKWE